MRSVRLPRKPRHTSWSRGHAPAHAAAASGSMRRVMRRLVPTRVLPASRRLLAGLAASLVGLLVAAPAAMAENDGRGFYGATNDKVITEAGFILVIFFPTFVLLASLLQKHLEKRKDARVAAARARAGDPRWRGGW
jgi:hypothetical protein